MLEDKAQESEEDDDGAQVKPSNVLERLLSEHVPKKRGITELDSDADDDDESSCAATSSADESDAISDSGLRREGSPCASSSNSDSSSSSSDSSEWDQLCGEMSLDPVKAVEMELEMMEEKLFSKYYENYYDSEDSTDEDGNGSSMQSETARRPVE